MTTATRNRGLPKMLYSIGEVAQLLCVSRPTVYELLNSGKLRGRKLGKRTLVRAEDLQTLIDGLPGYEAS